MPEEKSCGLYVTFFSVTSTLMDSPIITGYQLFHNYIRPHKALDYRTPAEAAGIEVKGNEKWLTLIQNASQSNLS
jgi:hypothetical protein